MEGLTPVGLRGLVLKTSSRLKGRRAGSSPAPSARWVLNSVWSECLSPKQVVGGSNPPGPARRFKNEKI